MKDKQSYTFKEKKYKVFKEIKKRKLCTYIQWRKSVAINYLKDCRFQN